VAETDVLTIVETAAFLKCGPKSIRRLARLRQIPHRKIDLKGTLRFSRAALERWLQEGGLR
jgi:hypothetical protein